MSTSLKQDPGKYYRMTGQLNRDREALHRIAVVIMEGMHGFFAKDWNAALGRLPNEQESTAWGMAFVLTFGDLIKQTPAGMEGFEL
jgi:hypothetical protein